MQPLRESLSRLLEAYEPNPALIVDGLWNLIESNRAASLPLVLPQLVAAAGQVGGLGGVAGQLDGFVVRRV
jgi:hypothetical protein